MLRKILILLALLSTIGTQSVFSLGEDSEQLLIIPRASWGANSLYNDVNSDYWSAILESRASYISPYRSPESVAATQEKNQKINNYLNNNFSSQFTSSETIGYNKNTNTEYAWDLKYTEYVDSIIVHHTHSEYDDDLTGLNQIHKYHSINRQWGDIGYNYIIGYDGVIYEGREGGDYVVGAHSSYNNFGTAGIAILGNYESNGINSEQYQSLELLIKNLTQKYGIDLSKKRYYHMACSGSKCDTFPIETYLDSSLIGHRDATHTTCPGDKLYEQIQKIRADNIDFTAGFAPIARSHNKGLPSTTSSRGPQIYSLLKVLSKYSQDELESLKLVIEIKLKQDLDYEFRKKLQILRLAVILSYDD